MPTLATATHSLLFHNGTIFSLSLEFLNTLILLPRSFSFPNIPFPKHLSHFRLNDTPIEKPAFSSYVTFSYRMSSHLPHFVVYDLTQRVSFGRIVTISYFPYPAGTVSDIW